MSEQEKFEAWWKEKGFNSVILRAAALTAWMARAEIDKDPQPAEDPDEWVIQDRVPIRVTIDRCWYMDGECGLPANPEDMWQKYNKDGFLDGKGHGDYVRDGGGTLHVMCRRRDLPKVEPKNCNGCGKPLLPENAWMEDGCSCNSPRGVN